MKGFKATEQMRERRAVNSKSNFARELWPGLMNPGDSVVVRFLEQGDEVHSAWMHEYQVNGRRRYVTCLDQEENGTPCPGCEGGLRRMFKGLFNVIFRDAPVLRRDSTTNRAIKGEDGRFIIDGHEDDVAVWMVSFGTFDTLASRDAKFKGLSSRDFEVTRSGRGRDTRYSVDPVFDSEGNAPAKKLSAADKRLAEKKYNLEELYLKQYTYEEMSSMLGGVRIGGVSQTDVAEARQSSPFSRANRFLQS